MSTKKNTTKQKSRKGAARAKSTKKGPGSPATEKARKAAIAEIQHRLDGSGASASANGTRSRKTKGGGTPKEPKVKRVSALDAAAKVLSDSAEPMRAKDLVERMKDKGLWQSPKGKTPEATIHASMIREIAAKGKDSRFRKVQRGLFTAGQEA